MTIIYDLVLPTVLNEFVRELPVPAAIELNTYLPDVLLDDIEAMFDEVQHTNRAAMFRSWDSESPIGKRDTMTRKRVALPPISQKTMVGEWERMQLQRLNGQNNLALTRQIYADAKVNADAVRVRAELARGDVLTDGIVTISENGLTLQADFGLPGTHNVTSAGVWSNPAYDIPSELMPWLDLFADDGGAPGTIVVSRQGARYMLNNTAFRQLASMNGVVPSTISLPQLNGVLDGYGYPPVVTYNSQFDVAGSAVRPIPNNRLLILPQNPRDLGLTAWGITAEALELVEAQQIGVEDAKGLVAVVMKSEDPVATWTKVGGVCLPIIENPRRLFSAGIF